MVRRAVSRIVSVLFKAAKINADDADLEGFRRFFQIGFAFFAPGLPLVRMTVNGKVF
jgi:hypothetical protein